MGRVDHWESKLVDYVQECSNKPFRWGSHDCATFAKNCVQLITGSKIDIPTWKTKKEAIELLREKPLDEYVGEYFEEININFARRGDVVATMTDEGMALGIFVSPTGVFASRNGICYVAHESLIKAWRI